MENFAPSISAAIGSFSPQKYIWTLCISLHISPRFLFIFLYKEFYETRVNNIAQSQLLIQAIVSIHVIELFALLGLSLVSSLENFDVHKVCFVAFGVSSLIYFVLTIFLWKNFLNLETNLEIKSLRVKTNVVKVYVFFGGCMSMFYYRHNEYCEPYVYSFFCICEYVIVVANMVFHATARYDFAQTNVQIPSRLRRGDYLPLVNPSSS